ncbi:MAG: hypothetical protein JJD92_10165 [Frankiaceae bacterium]|nr:hypothetical protein [Frankiaceae bacterium]
MGRTVTPLIRGVVAGAALLAVAAAAAGVLLLREDETPSGYRITYDVEDLVADVRTTEVVEVDGPLRSRRLTGRTGSATSEKGVFDLRDGRWRQVAVTPPGEVGQDLRLSAALAWAADRQLAANDGTATIAGQACTWWLTKEPLDIASVAPATTADRTRSCVDDKGRLLADVWRAGDRDLRRRTATQVSRADFDVFDGMTPEPLPPSLILTAVEAREEPVSDHVQLTTPPGWNLLAATRADDLEAGTIDVVRRTYRAVFGTATDVLVVDQIRGTGEARGLPVELPGLGTGRVQATGGGLVLTVPLGADQWLRVRTSLPYDELVEYVKGLTRR